MSFPKDELQKLIIEAMTDPFQYKTDTVELFALDGFGKEDKPHKFVQVHVGHLAALVEALKEPVS